jgi:hypothetical protein
LDRPWSAGSGKVGGSTGSALAWALDWRWLFSDSTSSGITARTKRAYATSATVEQSPANYKSSERQIHKTLQPPPAQETGIFRHGHKGLLTKFRAAGIRYSLEAMLH